MASATQGERSDRELPCPKCKMGLMTRMRRFGFLELKVFPRLGFFPWECSTCRAHVLMHDRGPRTRKRRSQEILGSTGSGQL